MRSTCSSTLKVKQGTKWGGGIRWTRTDLYTAIDQNNLQSLEAIQN